MRNLDELVNLSEPGWDLVKEWLKSAKNGYEILPRDKALCEKELLALQITTRSPMGAMAYECGGIAVAGGWLKILGGGVSGADEFKGICAFNAAAQENFNAQNAPFLIVAYDVTGGFFAINAGGLGKDGGNIYYLAPDSLAWEGFNVGYSQFLNWAFSGDLAKFYGEFYTEELRAQTQNLELGKVWSFYPFLWSKEGKDVSKTSRKAVSAIEQYKLTIDMMGKI